MMTLTPKQEAFVCSYLETGNASEAYRTVYSPRGKPNTVYPHASRLLTNGKIGARVAELTAEAAKRAMLTRERWLNELSAIAFGVSADVAPWDEFGPKLIPSDKLTREQQAIVNTVKVKRQRKYIVGVDGPEAWEVEELEVRPQDKMKALDTLGKAMGWLTEQVSLDGTLRVEDADGRVATLAAEFAEYVEARRIGMAGQYRVVAGSVAGGGEANDSSPDAGDDPVRGEGLPGVVVGSVEGTGPARS